MTQASLTVFICYSRRDARIADAIYTELTEKDYTVFMDRRTLPFGEEWKTELLDLIRAADSVVWLVSRDSIVSRWVEWELHQVQDLHKRLIPVVIADMPAEALPENIGRRQLLPSEGIFSLSRHLEDLCGALNRDHVWVKEHTRLAGLAWSWKQSGESRWPILRGRDLKAAQRWRDERPATVTQLDPDILDLLFVASRAAELRLRLWTGGALVVAAVLAFLAIYATIQRDLATTIAAEERSNAAAAEALNILAPVDRYTDWITNDEEGLPEFAASLDRVLGGVAMPYPARVANALDFIWRHTSPLIERWQTGDGAGIDTLEWSRTNGKVLVTSGSVISVLDGRDGADLASIDASFNYDPGDPWRAVAHRPYFARWCGEAIVVTEDDWETGARITLKALDGSVIGSEIAVPPGTVARCSPSGDMIGLVAPDETVSPEDIDWTQDIDRLPHYRDSGANWRYAIASMEDDKPVLLWNSIAESMRFVDLTYSHDGRALAIVAQDAAFVVDTAKPDEALRVDGRFLGWQKDALSFPMLMADGQLQGFRFRRGQPERVAFVRSRGIQYFDDVRFLDVQTAEIVQGGGLDLYSGVYGTFRREQLVNFQAPLQGSNVNFVSLAPDLLSVVILRGTCTRGNGPLNCLEVVIHTRSLDGETGHEQVQAILRAAAQIAEDQPAEIPTPIVKLGNLTRTYVGHVAAPTAVTWSPDGQVFLTASAEKTVSGGSVVDPNILVWPRPNPDWSITENPLGRPSADSSLAGLHDALIHQLCEGELVLSEHGEDFEAAELRSDYCDWGAGSRSGFAPIILGRWVTDLVWSAESRIAVGLTDSSCNACFGGAPVVWVEYDLMRGMWTGISTVHPIAVEAGARLFRTTGPSCGESADRVEMATDTFHDIWSDEGRYGQTFICVSSPDGTMTSLAHGSPVRTARLSPDGRLLLSVAEDGVARIFDLASSEEIRAFQIDESAHLARRTILGGAWSPDQRFIALIGSAGLAIRPIGSDAVVRDLANRSEAFR